MHQNKISSIVVFAGQGTPSVDSVHTQTLALHDASSPSGCMLLSECHRALLSELAALSSAQLDGLDIACSDFPTPESLLWNISPPKHRTIMIGTRIFLVQSLRYLASMEAQILSNNPYAPERHSSPSFSFCGFSSGILPACVSASSISTLDYISKSVAAFRVAFWIGVHTELYRRGSTQDIDPLYEDPENDSWSYVFLGMNREIALGVLKRFEEQQTRPAPLHLTAVVDHHSVTISGRPDALESFALSVSAKYPAYKSTVSTLFHCADHLGAARDDILADISRRNISFPTFSDLVCPVHSSLTGETLRSIDGETLLEAMVDAIMLHPVNWDYVLLSAAASASSQPVRLINVGPGSGLLRTFERSLAASSIAFESLDLTMTGIVPGTTSKTTGTSKLQQEPIAIVGMAINMPGAPDVSSLWRLLEEGLNTISEIPQHRFRVSDYQDPAGSSIATSSSTSRTMKAHTGNFIDGPDVFDNKFFKISPREARSLDPQQRILLPTTYEALEDAGYVPDTTDTWKRETFGCYVGAATGDYTENLKNDVDVYYATGTLRAFLSGRISYAMGFGGPSIVVDTACSSSLISIYQACRALASGDCNAAVAGGVNIITGPDMFLGLDRAHFLSPTGQCKPFDASADGYARSEGCGMFVLKRLSDALSENDNILGVIRGVEVNQSGLADSITHPHALTQTTLLKCLLQRSEIEPERVNVVEAHGTGTQAGDPTELESIRTVFASPHRSTNNPLYITSIKANIGHLEAASGAASLAKLLLMFKNKTIPRQAFFRELNPRILPLQLDDSVIPTRNLEWKPTENGLPRAGVVNNFGAAGSNAAMVVEEHIYPPSFDTRNTTYVFGLSAKTEEALQKLRERHIEWLQTTDGQEARLADIAYTATARRQLYNHRISFAVTDKDDLWHKLIDSRRIRSSLTTKSTLAPPKIAFVFSGQGSQYLGMGASLYYSIPLFRKCIDECHSLLTKMGFPGVLAIILGEGEKSGLDREEEVQAHQAAVFAIEWALAQVWMTWGVRPVVVVGHSLGEYAAQVIAGVLTLKGALMLIANRALWMAQRCALNATGMLAVNISSDSVTDIITSHDLRHDFGECHISCFNSPTDCVVSGPISQLIVLRLHLNELNVKNLILSVPYGYHSPTMLPVLDDLTSLAKRISIRAPTIPIVSNVYGEVVMPGDTDIFNAEYYAIHCAKPVHFERGLRSLSTFMGSGVAGAGLGMWVEIGPSTTTLPMLNANSGTNATAACGDLDVHKSMTVFLGSMRKGIEPWTTLGSTLAQMYMARVDVKWREVFECRYTEAPRCISMPTYPFAKTRFWVSYEEDTATLRNRHTKHVATATAAVARTDLLPRFAMLGSWAQHPSPSNGNISIFETPIEMVRRYIEGHKVGEAALCPASVYLELVLEAVACTRAAIEVGGEDDGGDERDNVTLLKDVEYANPLVYMEGVERVIRSEVTMPGPVGTGSFSVASHIIGSSLSLQRPQRSETTIHCTGVFNFSLFVDSSTTTNNSSDETSGISDRVSSLTSLDEAESMEIFSTRTIYEVVFPRVVMYSEEFRAIKRLIVGEGGMEGYAIVQVPELRASGHEQKSGEGKAGFVLHPVFLDTMLHAAGFLANLLAEPSEAFICSKLGFMDVPPNCTSGNDAYGIYVTLLRGTTSITAHVVVIEVTNKRGKEGECKKVVGSMGGIEFKKIRIASLRRSLVAFAGHRSLNHAVSARRTTVASAIPTTVHSQISTPQSPTPSDYRQSLVRPPYISRCSSHLSTASAAFTFSNLEPALDTRAEIVQIISQTCDISIADLGPDLDVELSNYGIDSLMSIEILNALREHFPSLQRLPSSRSTSFMAECRTIKEIIAAVEKLQYPDVSATSFIPLLPGDESFSTIATLVDDDESTAMATHTYYTRSSLDLSILPLETNVDISAQVKSILSSVLEVPVYEIGDDVGLDALGLDSLTSIEVQSVLWDALGVHKENRTGMETTGCALFERCETVRELVMLVKSQIQKGVRVRAQDKEGKPNFYPLQEEGNESAAAGTKETQVALGRLLQLNDNPLLIQPSSPLPLPSGTPSSPLSDFSTPVTSRCGRIPIVFIHDGSGLLSYLRRLPSIGRDLWGIQNPKFLRVNCGSDCHSEWASDGVEEENWDSVEEMAKEYTQYVLEANLRSQSQNGRCAVDEGVILAGWSFGGVVAFEIARQLLRHSNSEMRSLVRGVMLVDSPCPLQHVPISSTIIDAVLISQTSEPQSCSSPISGRRKDIQMCVKSQFIENAKLLERYGAAFQPPEDKREGGYVDDSESSYPPLVLLRSKEGFHPRGVPPEDVPGWLKHRPELRAGVAEWERLIGRGRIEVLEIPGDHFAAFKEENLAQMTLQLRAGCDYLEGRGRPVL